MCTICRKFNPFIFMRNECIVSTRFCGPCIVIRNTNYTTFTTRSFCQYLGKVIANQSMIQTRKSRSKSSIRFANFVPNYVKSLLPFSVLEPLIIYLKHFVNRCFNLNISTYKCHHSTYQRDMPKSLHWLMESRTQCLDHDLYSTQAFPESNTPINNRTMKDKMQ